MCNLKEINIPLCNGATRSHDDPPFDREKELFAARGNNHIEVKWRKGTTMF